MRLLLIRHADPDYETDALTDLGRREAGVLADRLAGLEVTHLYTSPLGRARETAGYTAAVTGLVPEVLPWTAELRMAKVADALGVPVPAWSLPGELVRGGDVTPTDADWDRLPVLNGYDFRARHAELTAASDGFLAGLGYRRTGGTYRAGPPDRHVVAVFCHLGFGLAWLSHLLALPLTLAWCGFFLAPASVTTILLERRTPDVAVPRALAVGDTTHLRMAGIPDSTRGLRSWPC